MEAGVPHLAFHVMSDIFKCLIENVCSNKAQFVAISKMSKALDG